MRREACQSTASRFARLAADQAGEARGQRPHRGRAVDGWRRQKTPDPFFVRLFFALESALQQADRRRYCFSINCQPILRMAPFGGFEEHQADALVELRVAEGVAFAFVVVLAKAFFGVLGCPPAPSSSP